MDTTTAAAGIGSSIGKSFYLKKAKAILIEITSDLVADDSTCHPVEISHFFTFKYIRTDRAVGVNNIKLLFIFIFLVRI